MYTNGIPVCVCLIGCTVHSGGSEAGGASPLGPISFMPVVWEILDPPLVQLLACTAQPKGHTKMWQVFVFARVW